MLRVRGIKGLKQKQFDLIRRAIQRIGPIVHLLDIALVAFWPRSY